MNQKHAVQLMGWTLAACAAVGCARAPQGSPRPLAPDNAVLSRMGFALTNDGDAATPAGALDATFDAPVLGVADELTDPGTATVTFDDGARALASAVILDAYPELDVAYAVLFDPSVPWRYVVVAAPPGALVAGADVVLDGEQAAAVVVDEATGDGFLSSSGTLSVTAASLVSGGRLAGSLHADLVEVTLQTWPEGLFPLTGDGSAATHAEAAGQGTFHAVPTDGFDDMAGGPAAFDVTVAGYAPFHADLAQRQALDDVSAAIVLFSSAAPDRVAVVVVPTAAIVAGNALSLDGLDAGAWLLLEDGTQVAFAAGSLTIDGVAADGAVDGTLTVSGDALVFAPDANLGEGEGEPRGDDCAALPTLAATFVPATAYVQEGIEDELTPGFDTALTFSDAASAIFTLIVPTAVDLRAGGTFAFTTVDVDGFAYPQAMLQLMECGQLVFVDGGSLTAILDDDTQRLSGTLAFTAQEQSREIAFDVPLVL